MKYRLAIFFSGAMIFLMVATLLFTLALVVFPETADRAATIIGDSKLSAVARLLY